MDRLLSIVIPVYNVERYLEKCLHSVVEQLDETIEVIIVNDGSPDNSAAIIEKYREAYPSNIVVVNQKNQGLSMARNNGLERSCGEYVWFVDSDDWLKGDAIARVKSEIATYPDVDVFSSFLAEYYEKDESIVERKYSGDIIMSGTEYLKRMLPQGASPRFIYKHCFLSKNELRFVPGLLHEDAIWGYMMLYKAQSVKIIESPVYVYRIRLSDSIMSSIHIKSAYDLVKGHKLLISWMENNVAEKDKRLFEYRIFGLIKSLLDFCKNLLGTEEYNSFLTENKSYLKKSAKIAYSFKRTDFSLLIIAFNPNAFSRLCSIKNIFS